MSKLELNGITWDHSRGYDPLVAASKLYLENEEVKISWQKRSLKDFGDKSLLELSRTFDLLIIDHPHVGVAAAEKCVLPLEKFMSLSDIELLKSQSAGPSFGSYCYKNHQWALPVDAAMQCATYRKDLFAEKIPRTWKEALAMDHMGTALCPTDSLCTFLTLTAQLGKPVREQYKPLIEEATGVEVLNLMKSIRSKSHPDSLHWNPIQLFDHMAEYDDVAYAPLVFCYTNYSRDGYRKNRLSFTHAPGRGQSILGGAGIAVSRCCKQKDEAVRFATWLCSEAVQKGVYVSAQGQPANSRAWADKSANILTNDFFKNTLSSLEKAYVRPRFQEWPKFQEYMGEVIHDCLKKDTVSATVVRHLNEQFDKINF